MDYTKVQEYLLSQHKTQCKRYGHKLRIETTEDDAAAGATDTSHMSQWIDIQGTDIDASQELNFECEAQVQQKCFI